MNSTGEKAIVNWEAKLQEVIFPELEKGRPDFDKPHTQAVVIKIKTIIEQNPQLNLDRNVLVIAAYAHDWGYSGLFEAGKPAQMTEVMEAKKAHMIIGAQKIAELLRQPEFDFLSKDQKARVVHLVSVHDKLNELKDIDELILMEADTLGAADISMVGTTFDYASNLRWTLGVLRKRAPQFITDYAKSEIGRLLAEREKYYSK